MNVKQIPQSIYSKLHSYYTHLTHLVYPNLCVCCDGELPMSEEYLCFICKNELHHTDFDLYEEESNVDKLFWGRVNVNKVFSLLYYKNNTQSQRILHHLKYDNRPDLAYYMGELIGEKIGDNEIFKTIDLLIPVPIHDKKKYIRGYNQSEHIAQGIADKTKIACSHTLLKRTLHTVSQTKKGKFERWDNVQEAFEISAELPEEIQHIAIVDDVITTGSTLETIIRLFHEQKELKISIISIAYAGN